MPLPTSGQTPASGLPQSYNLLCCTSRSTSRLNQPKDPSGPSLIHQQEKTSSGTTLGPTIPRIQSYPLADLHQLWGTCAAASCVRNWSCPTPGWHKTRNLQFHNYQSWNQAPPSSGPELTLGLPRTLSLVTLWPDPACHGLVATAKAESGNWAEQGQSCLQDLMQ